MNVDGQEISKRVPRSLLRSNPVGAVVPVQNGNTTWEIRFWVLASADTGTFSSKRSKRLGNLMPSGRHNPPLPSHNQRWGLVPQKGLKKSASSQTGPSEEGVGQSDKPGGACTVCLQPSASSRQVRLRGKYEAPKFGVWHSRNFEVFWHGRWEPNKKMWASCLE